MVILYDTRRSVNPARPFGAGVLPPDVPPAPRRPFEPTPDDRAWWAAESDRIARQRTSRPAWIYSRSDRLTALIQRARVLESYLARERCDARHPADRATIDARLAILSRRVHALCHAARDARRLDRYFDRLAADSAAVDSLTAGLIPRDVADHIARTTLVGHPA